MTDTAFRSARVDSTTSLVARSATTTAVAAVRKSRRSAPLGILFLLLARDAEPRVRQGIEAVEPDLGAAGLALPELVGGRVEAAEGLVHVPEIASFLRRHQELLLPLHRVGALVRHVERVGRE